MPTLAFADANVLLDAILNRLPGRDDCLAILTFSSNEVGWIVLVLRQYANSRMGLVSMKIALVGVWTGVAIAIALGCYD